MLRIAASHACTAFQFPPLREGRLFSGVSKGAMSIFQFPPLREGRPVLPCSWRRGKHFNSRPSARGDGEKPPKGQISFTISIHAPPRGATVGIRHQQVAVGISIHAPPRGATKSRQASSGSAWIFQFTPLREGRPVQHAVHSVRRVSLHA